jgi:hypothetical protein
VRRTTCAAAAALAAGGAFAACPLSAPALAADGVQLAWRVDGGPPAVGRMFALTVDVCPADARLRRVDATMPEHRHGMNYRPGVKPAGEGRWRVEGLMFHMAGAWELRFDVETPGGPRTLRQPLHLP